MVRQIDTMAEFEKALSDAGDKLVVVDFTATWCGPCKWIGPKFVEMSESPEFSNVVFLKVDVDENTDVTGKYEVRSMPTFIFIKHGKKVDQFSGADEKTLREKLEALK